MKKFLLLIVIALISQNSSAKMADIQNFLYQAGFLEDPRRQICPEDFNTKNDYSENELWAKAESALTNSDLCKAAENFKSIILQFPSSARYQEAFRAFVMAYLNAQDYLMTINEANKYLEVNPVNENSEYIHLMLLRAVDGQIKSIGSMQKKMEFISYSLGASSDQNEQAPYLLNLNFRRFLDLYPQSKFTSEVTAMLDESRQFYSANVLNDARWALLKLDYSGAIKKYNIILQWGPTVLNFEEALYEAIKVHFELSWILTNKNLMTDYRLNLMLKRDTKTVSTMQERNELAKQTRDRGQNLLTQMKKNLVESPWTAKAVQVENAYPVF